MAQVPYLLPPLLSFFLLFPCLVGGGGGFPGRTRSTFPGYPWRKEGGGDLLGERVSKARETRGGIGTVYRGRELEKGE